MKTCKLKHTQLAGMFIIEPLIADLVHRVGSVPIYILYHELSQKLNVWKQLFKSSNCDNMLFKSHQVSCHTV